jgi:general stress protein 26
MWTVSEATTGLNSRPMTPLEMDHDGAIWMMASKQSLRAALGSTSMPVNLAFARPDHDEYISISGHASFVDDPHRKASLWTVAGRPWFDGPQDPDLALVKVTPRHVEIWEGPDSSIVRVLAMAASVVSARPVGMGHKQTLDM